MFWNRIDPRVAAELEDAVASAERRGDYEIEIEYSNGRTRWVSLAEARDIAFELRGGDNYYF